MRVELTAAAELELDEAVEYYENRRSGLGKEFALEFRRAAMRICDFPRACPRLSGGDDIRRCQLNRFPYGLVYSIEGDVALVLAVMHLRRKPDYWRERVAERK